MFSNPLHVRCGDDILDKLRAAGLPGQRMKWSDPVSIGPTPGTTGRDAWYRMRARYLARMADHPQAQIEAGLREQDEALLDIEPHDALVLWFEHDLFDQSILIAILAKLAGVPGARERLYMVTTDRFPGHDRFIGLGQLSAAELRTLYERASRVTDAQVELAGLAWDAWRSDDPTGLQQLLDSDTAALPFLRGAIRRHLQDLPWTRDGLSLTERLSLTPLRHGRMSAGELFAQVQAAEEHPWMGDTMLYDELERLRFLPSPLIAAAGDKPMRGATPVEMTHLAREIVDGAVHAMAANPVDRWVGGVHVTAECPWRWDGQRVTPLQR